MPTAIPIARRKEIFAAVVEAQDAREAVAARFEATADQVAAVEQEGIAKDWPPL